MHRPQLMQPKLNKTDLPSLTHLAGDSRIFNPRPPYNEGRGREEREGKGELLESLKHFTFGLLAGLT